MFPALFTAVLWAFGWALPLSIPTLAGPLLGAGLSVIPNLEVTRSAAVARSEFTRAVGAYTDLVALERQAGAGTAQALEAAATVGDSWVFVRIREELARARWSGRAPWDALSDLGTQIQVAGLGDLGDIMRLSGEQGVGRGRRAARPRRRVPRRPARLRTRPRPTGPAKAWSCPWPRSGSSSSSCSPPPPSCGSRRGEQP